MSKGFLWFAQNNDKTDYVDLSIKLAKSIKHRNKENKVCVITDEKSKFESKHVDIVRVLKRDNSEDHDIKWANEYQAFALTPFTHTIKLEADMAWTTNTDWWWNHLWQHDLVFSVGCRDYKDNIIKETPYRKLFTRNDLPNIYNGLMYFRRSKKAQQFYSIAQDIVENWEEVRSTMLIACHDKYPSTDVVFALAYRIMDPTNESLIDYEWFKFIHHKPAVHGLTRVKDQNNYLWPNKTGDALYIGERRVSRVWHYHDKELNARIF
tara:strand:- start:155 stop:949 length:795 start_codon:yes stop_codon:yes gene_type:complete